MAASYTVANRQVDLRVSTLADTIRRIGRVARARRALDHLDIGTLGFPKYLHDYVTEAIQRPNGILIVTGPTGLGQDDDALSCMRKVNTMIPNAHPEDRSNTTLKASCRWPSNDAWG